MHRTVTLLLLVSGLLFAPVEAGHELPYYPSFYPQEIRIEVMGPRTAAVALRKGDVHAYVGEIPDFDTAPPASIQSVASLGSYLVVTFDPEFVASTSRPDRCALARQLLATLPEEKDYVFHPYPITPFHGGYLHHFDLVQSLKARLRQPPSRISGGSIPPLHVRARGPVAARLLPANHRSASAPWQATIEQIDIRDMLWRHSMSLNGWLGPPWRKAGWFHAYLLLGDAVQDAAMRQKVAAMYRRLRTGEFTDAVEQINLERAFVTSLQQGCERVVIGYTVKREFFNAEFSAGIENIASDALTGMQAPIFLRTVKLKDLPWNGWLRLGVPGEPAAAWNPIGGFTDPTGRLIWYAVGDLALFPAPYGNGWVLDRLADYQATLTRPPAPGATAARAEP